MLDIHDLAIAREAGSDLVAVGALVGKPLAALIAQPGVARPRDLEGRTVGVSGLPSDPAFLRAIVEHDGGDYERVKQVTIGFNAVSRLLTKRVDAVPAFWNAEGVALQQRGLAAREFRVEDYGAPAYPEVVLVTARKTLDARARADRGARWTRSRPGCGPRGRGRTRRSTVIARAAETDDTRARARPARRGAADLRRRPAARPRRCSSSGRTSTRGSGSSRSGPTWSARSTSRCALKRGAPEPCHGPGCLRSRWWPLAARLQSREWRVRGLAAVTYVLRVRRINHLLRRSIAQMP